MPGWPSRFEHATSKLARAELVSDQIMTSAHHFTEYQRCSGSTGYRIELRDVIHIFRSA